MRPEIKIYIAAKVEHAAKLAALSKDGFHFNARWIHMAALGAESMKPVTHWQQENFDDIEAAHFVIFYVEPGDKLKGALMEIGYAIRAGKHVWIVGDGHGVEIPIPGEPVMVPGEAGSGFHARPTSRRAALGQVRAVHPYCDRAGRRPGADQGNGLSVENSKP
jgi:hypothetical protein